MPFRLVRSVRRLFAPSTDKPDRKAARREALAAEAQVNAGIVAATPVLRDMFDLTPHYLPCDEPFPLFNTAALSTETGFLMLARSCNSLCLNDGTYIHRDPSERTSVNILFETDGDLQITRRQRLDNSLAEAALGPGAIEDIRLFAWRGAIWGLGAWVQWIDATRYRAEQVVIRIEGGRIVEAHPIPSPGGARIEKNWVPLVAGDDLFLVQSLAPLHIHRFEAGRIVTHKGDAPAGKEFPLRGGTPFIPFRGHHLSLAHQAPRRANGKIYYLHQFVLLDAQLDLIEISDPFFIQRRGIEFACGLQPLDAEALLLTYGVSDRRAAHARLPIRAVERFCVI
ncbi:hypothetical protein [Prosthecodimorpha staleyi]|uniref:Uncharacterized protein n=1 Tax=Prosthecodimorpha staleyi TaxID=2840188 RepID=A0A947D476_9HYPH|nr:hypothetical protein [Prosthecodimorpha staleyi]MBT9290715.1 hypothetical protein [Prosthecodimorpha staleyi]